MGTITESLTEVPSKKRNLVEMSWDPITRIVGSLGIFTKIDFEARQVAECYSTSSIFRGYSIFMKARIRAPRTSLPAASAAYAETITLPAPLMRRIWRSA